TCAVPAEATSSGAIDARRRPEPRNRVGRGDPFTFTVDAVLKLLPETVRSNRRVPCGSDPGIRPLIRGVSDCVGVVPLPVRFTVTRPRFGSLLSIVSVPVCVPLAVGEKRSEIT